MVLAVGLGSAAGGGFSQWNSNAPGCPRAGDADRAAPRRFASCTLVFFYGTPWSDDEMIRLGVGSKPGRPIGHMSMSGEDATIDDSAISVSAVGSLSKKRVCVRSAPSTTTTNILFIS